MEPGHIVVIGGGPAGGETARVAAERGHTVTVLEQGSVVGGALLDAGRLPNRAPIADIASWHHRELTRLGVDLRLGVTATVELVESLAPDVVVVATGAAGGQIPDTVPERAVVVDRHGGYEALGIAEWLVDQGATVAMTSTQGWGKRVRLDNIVDPTLDRLRDRGVDVRAGEIEQIEQGETPVIIEKMPRVGLVSDLKAAGFDVRVVGDAGRLGGTMEAIHSGNAVGRAV
jgi:NADPH-dependent 2,4-dienoyl-CoA reductase/sulfur reductase-like enzyme